MRWYGFILHHNIQDDRVNVDVWIEKFLFIKLKTWLPIFNFFKGYQENFSHVFYQVTDPHPPLPNRILRDTVNDWAVRILLECILVLMYRFMVGLCVGHYIMRKIVQFFIYPVSVDKSPRFIDNSVTGE